MGGRTLHYPFYAVDCQLSVGLVLLEGSLRENNFFFDKHDFLRNSEFLCNGVGSLGEIR